jgi:hypothetical protein
MDFDIITEGLKKAFDTFVQNIVAYIVGFIIGFIGICLIITAGPAMYGLYYMAIKGARGEKVEIKDIFYGLSSVNAFIRSWIGLIGFLLIPAIIWIIYTIIATIAMAISLALGIIISLLSLVLAVITLLVMVVLYYTLYIYIMTPSENIIYAIKESISIGKSNFIMVLLTMIIASITSILWVTTPLGIVFAANVLKELKPELKDGSGL